MLAWCWRRFCSNGLIGRLKNLRIAGKSLVFLDIEQDGHTLQAVCKAGGLDAFTGINQLEFQRFYHLVRRGDIICESWKPSISCHNTDKIQL